MNSDEFLAGIQSQKEARVEQIHRKWLQDKLSEYMDGEEYVPGLDAAPFLDWVYGEEIWTTFVNSEEQANDAT